MTRIGEYERVGYKLGAWWRSVLALVAGVAAYVVVVDISDYAAAMVVIAVIVVFAALALMSTTLQAILTASVYRYAATGEGSGMFPAAVIQDAFGSPRDS